MYMLIIWLGLKGLKQTFVKASLILSSEFAVPSFIYPESGILDFEEALL